MRKSGGETRTPWPETSQAEAAKARRLARRVLNPRGRVIGPILLVLCLTLPAAWLKYVGDPFEKPGVSVSALDLQVIDGDTVHYAGERIRLSNLDAPEMPGRAKCPDEATLAVAAQLKLAELLRTGPLILLHRQTIIPKDVYSRTLARITVNGVDVADTMRKAGVARRYGFDVGWC